MAALFKLSESALTGPNLTNRVFHTFCCLQVILLLLCGSGAAAQPYRFRTFTTAEGLSSYNANHLLQDTFGFIWICTQEGINRFDGRTFDVIKKQTATTKSLNATYVTECRAGPGGLLWTSTQFGGIDVINPSTLEITFRLNEATDVNSGFISNWVRTMEWYKQEQLWIGTYYGINSCDPSGKNITAIRDNPIVPHTDFNISFLMAGGNNSMLACSENQGIALYDAESRKLQKVFSKKDLSLPEDSYFNINDGLANGNELLLCTTEGLFVYNSTTRQVSRNNILTGAIPANRELRCIQKNEDGNYWIGTDMGIYIISPSGKLKATLLHDPDTPNSLLSDYVNDIFSDRFHNTWISTSKGLSLLLQQEYSFDVINRDQRSGNVLEHTFSITPASDSLVLVSDKTGFYFISLPGKRISRIADNTEWGVVDGVCRIKPGIFLFSGLRKLGVLQLQQGRVTTLPAAAMFPELKEVQAHAFAKIISVNDSLVLFGSLDESGLYKWNPRTHTVKHFTTQSGLADNYIQNIRIDTRGRIWILSDRAITTFNPETDTFQPLYASPSTAGSINSYFILDMYDDGRRTWLATYGGGINYSDSTRLHFSGLTESEGLNSNSTYCIIPENDSLVWVSSNNGLTRIHTGTKALQRYYFGDGLQSSSFEIRSAAKTKDYILFGGIDGITIINRQPAFRGNNLHQFPVFIKAFELVRNGTRLRYDDITGQQLRIGPNPDQLVFYMAGLSYQHINRLKYEYKIDGFNKHWVAIPEGLRVSLAGLTHGRYTLLVRSSDDDVSWNYSPPFRFEILPRWFQTWWFKTVIGLVIAGLAWTFYRLRINQLKKEQQIRTKLASDLHDDLGSTINSIKVFANLAVMEYPSGKYPPLIVHSSQEAITSIRDMIWVLDDSKDTVEHLLNRLDQFALPLCEASGVQFIRDCNDPSADLRLAQEEKRNLFLLLKEAVNNAIKYAAATTITLQCRLQKGNPQFLLSDTGKGFDNKTVAAGNGLKNMQYRAHAIGYLVDVDSAPGAGTRILIRKK